MRSSLEMMSLWRMQKRGFVLSEEDAILFDYALDPVTVCSSPQRPHMVVIVQDEASDSLPQVTVWLPGTG